MNIADNTAIRNCTSCQACATVCPKNAISIILNEDGFYRPVIDEEKCINCGMCKNVCYKFDDDIKLTTDVGLKEKKLYSAWVNDDNLLAQTTSGGIGDLLARQLIAEGYKVVGVAYNDELVRAEHVIADTTEATTAFRGSKYIQSYSFDALKQVIANCKGERYAIFGTPCQIYALNRYAEQRKVRENLVLIDLYCHGCPSLRVWQKYQSSIKMQLGSNSLNYVNFRSKVKGWGAFYVTAKAANEQLFNSKPGADGFYELFFSDIVLNESCHDCKLRSTLEYTDIRLGDFWGKKFLSNRKGVSAVSISSIRGQELFNKIKSSIVYDECDYKDFFPYQSWGKDYKPDMRTREELLTSLKHSDATIDDAVQIYRKRQPSKLKIKRHIKNILHYLPLGVTMFLKRFI